MLPGEDCTRCRGKRVQNHHSPMRFFSPLNHLAFSKLSFARHAAATCLSQVGRVTQRRVAQTKERKHRSKMKIKTEKLNTRGFRSSLPPLLAISPLAVCLPTAKPHAPYQP